ncbi:MAG: hypothetical protein ACR2L2_10370 [Acidobacteriota bacterium]
MPYAASRMPRARSLSVAALPVPTPAYGIRHTAHGCGNAALRLCGEVNFHIVRSYFLLEALIL